MRSSEKLLVVVNHGESGSTYNVVDAAAPEASQPKVLAGFTTWEAAITWIFRRRRRRQP